MWSTRAWQKFTLQSIISAKLRPAGLTSRPSPHDPLFQIVVEPCSQTINYVAPVFGLKEFVPLAGIDDQLRFHAERLECPPEFTGLGHGAFAIVLADQHQCGRLHILYKSDGSAPRIDRGIVVHRGAEIGGHPFVNIVLTVVALPVR